MPYCCQCGRAVGGRDQYCGNCGARQPASAPIDPFSGVSNRTASLLCYIPVVGWLAAIVVLASSRFRNDRQVRFNAFQGLYLFVAWLIVEWVTPILFFAAGPMRNVLPTIAKAVVFGGWIFMIIKTAQDETFKLPLLGELAEKSVAEQRA